jgi:HEPN domain-containing protein
MRDSRAEAERWLRQAEHDLAERVVIGHSLVELAGRLQDRVPALRARREDAGILDQYYVPTRYPNGLAGGVPFEAFAESQASAALAAAERFLELARAEVRPA